ncbi:YdaU family protein [Ferrovum myxofaciens]|uniref:YdaU family protein n=1 Tax=Ferrovum myxofaciens TaxID=416213 RepID=UPI003EB96952
MSKPSIWMPLYIADYLADTGRLTTEQHGAYLLLIMDYWRNGPPPDNDLILANITRLNLETWKEHRSSIAKLFAIKDDEWRHKRIDFEIRTAFENSSKFSERAKTAASKRWGKTNDDATSMLEACNKQSSSSPQAVLEQSSIDATSMQQACNKQSSSSPQAVLKQC